MTLMAPDRRRCIPVQLTSVPLERRLKAAEKLIVHENDALSRIEIMTCAWWPSETVYWISRGVAA